MSGLLHISQISFDRIEDLPSILAMGMKLKCMIIDHDKVGYSSPQLWHLCSMQTYVHTCSDITGANCFGRSAWCKEMEIRTPQD